MEFLYESDSGQIALRSERGAITEEGQWIHVGVVLSLTSGELSLFKNGRRIASRGDIESAPINDPQSHVRIGRGAYGPLELVMGRIFDRQFFGSISNIRLGSIQHASASKYSSAD